MSLLFLAVGNLSADDPSGLETQPLPPGPILAKLPDMNAWQINISYESGSSSTGKPAPGTEEFPRQVTVTETKPVWRTVIVTLDGNTVECWGTSDMCYLVPKPGEKPAPVWKKDLPGRYNGRFLAGRFPDLEWISPATYVGVEGGALVFRQQGEKGAEARIAISTRFPISWKKGTETRTFRLLPPPVSPLVLPPDVAKAAAEFERVNAIINGAPTR